MVAALHRRLEALREADARLEREDGAAELAPARSRIAQEAEALRISLLFQHPESWRDLLILSHHLSVALWDLARDGGERAAAAATAGESLFDFLAGHVDEDHEPFGESFQAATVEAYYNVRHRQGVIER